MILNRDYGAFGVKRSVFTFDHDLIGKFERTVDRKQDFERSAVLDDGILNKNATVSVGVAIAISISIAIAIRIPIAHPAAEPNGNPHRRGPREKSGQAAYEVLAESRNSRLNGHL
jgi:hypothetical protein